MYEKMSIGGSYCECGNDKEKFDMECDDCSKLKKRHDAYERVKVVEPAKKAYSDEQICKLYLKGFSTDDIWSITGTGHKKVKSILEENNIPIRHRVRLK